jgi:uncharacterized protein (TIGR02246 family)
MISERTDVWAAIRASDDAFEGYIRAQQAAQVAEGAYAPDAVVLPPDQPPLRGRAAIATFWQGMFQAGLREAPLTIEQVETSGDLASEIGTYALTLQPDGTAAMVLHGKYLVVHQRQADGSWKIIADMFSGNGPA